MRGAALALIGGLIYAIAPRRILAGSVVATCRTCAHRRTTQRWEPVPPPWIPLRYPGVHWTSDEPAAGGRCQACGYDVAVRAEFRAGSVSGRGGMGPDERTIVNGIGLSLDNGPEVLKALMAPDNFGIQIGTLRSAVDDAGFSIQGSWRMSWSSTRPAP